MLSLWKLEYFWRFQLDLQRKFYLERGVQHSEDAERASSRQMFAMLLAGLGGALGGFPGAASPNETITLGANRLRLGQQHALFAACSRRKSSQPVRLLRFPLAARQRESARTADRLHS